MTKKNKNEKENFHLLFNQLQVQRLVSITVAPR